MTTPPRPAPSAKEPQVDGGRPNGFVVVVLDRDVDLDPARDLAEVLQDAVPPPPPGQPPLAPPDRLRALLAALGDPPTSRLVTPESLAAVRELQRGVDFRDGLLDLTRFWRIDLRDGRADPEEVARRFVGVPGVARAYAESRVARPRPPAPPTAPPTTTTVPPTGTGTPSTTTTVPPGGTPPGGPAGPPGTTTVALRAATVMLAQGHLDKARVGVGATEVRTRCGGRGQGVRFADVERGWRLTHPAYSAHTLSEVSVAPLANCDGVVTPTETLVGDHGTAVLGVVAATGLGVKVVGVAPEVEQVVLSSHYDRVKDEDLHVVPAIAQAVAGLRRGDVLLLEVQREGGQFQGDLPTEIELADFTAIASATRPEKGIVVVEAAANGERDLDLWRHPDGRAMTHGGPGDSGAILVGSCNAKTGTVGHLRFSSSNWGARVDCHAWGESVATAEATATTADYTTNFKETSAAAAIVAGAACVTQGMQLATHPGAPLDPATMREFLSGPTNTAQQPETPLLRIGRMPDLLTIANRIGAAVCADDDGGGPVVR